MRALFALAAALLAACGPHRAAAPVSRDKKPLARVSFHPLKVGAPTFTVPFSVAGAPNCRAVFDRQDMSYRVRLEGARRAPCELAASSGSEAGEVRQVGRIDLEGRGNQRLFVVKEEGGTGQRTITLSLLDAVRCKAVSLSMIQRADISQLLTDVERSSGLSGEARDFLESAKYSYGYVGPDVIEREKDNSRFAFHHWRADHGDSADVKLTPRRYKGRPSWTGTVSAELRDGDVSYLGYFKAGVVAFDRAANRHWVVFHPRDMNAWPTALKKSGDYLVIGTRGEGLALINLKTQRLKRVKLDEKASDVRKLEVKGRRAVINGATKYELPTF